MNISENWKKVKFFANYLFVPTIVICVGLSSFFLGKVSKIEELRIPITIDSSQVASNTRPINGLKLTSSENQEIGHVNDTVEPASTTLPNKTKNNTFVASKRGTKYYPIDCKAANVLSDTNKIYFKDENEAKKAGYTASPACKSP